MKKSTITLPLLIFATILFAQQGKQIVKKIDDIIQPLVKTNNYSGTALVSKDGNILYHKAFGKMSREYGIDNREDTKFFLASVSMIFTAIAVLQLQEQGKLSIDDSLAKYFPSNKRWAGITLKQMLAQRSGIPAIGASGKPDYDSLTKFTQTAESLIKHFENENLLFIPGS